MNLLQNYKFKIFPLGENALTVEFGNSISEKFNRRAVALAKYFEENPFSGLLDTAAAYSSLTLFFDCYVVKHTFPNFPTAFSAVKNLAENALENLSETEEVKSRLIEIPVDFSAENALDLNHVAEINKIAPREVVEIFTAQTFRVFMLGFLPGFAYLGEVDERIAAPRKNSPRTKIPAGSVGIAGRQTGVYPLESPGGWQIIGRTNVKMFDLKAENPFVLRVGDRVKFYESFI